MKVQISILMLACACAGNVFAGDDIAKIIDAYDRREAILLYEFATGLTNRTFDATGAILELGSIRSSKAVPLLTTNLMYRYINNQWGILFGGVGRTTPIFGPVPRALGNIKPPLQTLLSMLNDAAMPTEVKNHVVFSMCLGLYKEYFLDEMLSEQELYDEVYVSRAASISPKRGRLRDIMQRTPEIGWYETAVADLMSEYWDSRKENDVPRLSNVLSALGHLRALRAKPDLMDFLRNPPEKTSREMIGAHQEALKKIGLSLEEILNELKFARYGSEWKAFLVEYGEEVEGAVFLRALERSDLGKDALPNNQSLESKAHDDERPSIELSWQCLKSENFLLDRLEDKDDLAKWTETVKALGMIRSQNSISAPPASSQRNALATGWRGRKPINSPGIREGEEERVHQGKDITRRLPDRGAAERRIF